MFYVTSLVIVCDLLELQRQINLHQLHRQCRRCFDGRGYAPINTRQRMSMYTCQPVGATMKTCPIAETVLIIYSTRTNDIDHVQLTPPTYHISVISTTTVLSSVDHTRITGHLHAWPDRRPASLYSRSDVTHTHTHTHISLITVGHLTFSAVSASSWEGRGGRGGDVDKRRHQPFPVSLSVSSWWKPSAWTLVLSHSRETVQRFKVASMTTSLFVSC